ncbi:hypothetical protein [Candidatus Agathobaculum pullicola]|uniref:hypothetical protein n=1 Tax=Candidatus Agathobaculum pullicola TaxID=2838426 RepID=UPI003F92C0F3
MSNPVELELLELLEPELLPLLGRLELLELELLELLPELVLLLGFLLLDIALFTALAAAPAIPAINDAKPILFNLLFLILTKHRLALRFTIHAQNAQPVGRYPPSRAVRGFNERNALCVPFV